MSLLKFGRTARVGAEAVEPILRFMESHPLIDYGVPAALTHFIGKQFNGEEYEQKLVDSINRQPTPQTVWMPNRRINGIDGADRRDFQSESVKQAKMNSSTDEMTRQNE